jgi:hypothetical protein
MYVCIIWPLTLYPQIVSEAPQIFLRDAHVLPKWRNNNEYSDVTDGNPIAAWSQSLSDVSLVL